MVNLIAVTTVLLVRADCDVRCVFKLASNVCGSIRVSLPRHSDTTFLVPSSGHSQWVNSIFLQLITVIIRIKFSKFIDDLKWLSYTCIIT